MLKRAAAVMSNTDEINIRDNIAKLYSRSAEVRLVAAETLRDLACNDANREAIREAQGISPLVEQLKDPDTELRKNAAAALWNLASNNEANKNAIREAQGIAPIVGQLEDPNTEVRKNAAGALGNLASNNIANKDAIREAQGITPLVAQLKDTNTEVRKYVAGALWNLACNHPINQAAIVDADAAPALRKLAISDVNARKTLAVCETLLESRKKPAVTNLPTSTTTASDVLPYTPSSTPPDSTIIFAKDTGSTEELPDEQVDRSPRR